MKAIKTPDCQTLIQSVPLQSPVHRWLLALNGTRAFEASRLIYEMLETNYAKRISPTVSAIYQGYSD